MSDNKENKSQPKGEVEKFTAKVDRAKNFERANTVASSTIKKALDSERLSSKEDKRSDR
jgi:hypothetical protein